MKLGELSEMLRWKNRTPESRHRTVSVHDALLSASKRQNPSFLSSARKGRSNLEPDYIRHVSEVIELLQGKWTIQILCAMRAHPVRLSLLRREIPVASKKALTASLRSLQAARMVVRRDLSSSVLHVEYELVESMRIPLNALLDDLSKWGKYYESERSPHA